MQIVVCLKGREEKDILFLYTLGHGSKIAKDKGPYGAEIAYGSCWG